MEAIYLDIHIHTSENPDNLNTAYDIDTLVQNINKCAQDSPFLISLTDHNTINKSAYLKAVAKEINILLGAELHINNYDSEPAYHCHIIFNTKITEDIINDINGILDRLYPQKQVVKKDSSIPKLDKIIKEFDKYDFILLPHGGQSHCTFDKSIPEGVQFDTTMERSIYYNQFDGFTARANAGLESTIKYFKRLGINEFVNLITCTDNYDPQKYPSTKNDDANPFVPTWMFSMPTFNGLRISLSESSRLIYSKEKPQTWSEYINRVNLKEEKIDIDIELTSGLNVVIGGSSSGKTLLVDSINRKISGENFNNSPYKNFGVERINIVNPANITPHFLSQNYIMKVVDNDSSAKIEDIDIVKSVFPEDVNLREQVNTGLSKLQSDISSLINCVMEIETECNTMRSIPQISRLFILNNIQKNIFNNLLPSNTIRQNLNYNKQQYDKHIETLNIIKNFLYNNPFTNNMDIQISEIQQELLKAYQINTLENNIYSKIKASKTNYDNELKAFNLEDQTKNQEFDKLIKSISRYIITQRKFKKIINQMSQYSIKFETKEIESMGHKLYIQNQFELSKQKILEVFNNYLKTGTTLLRFEDIKPEALFKVNFKQKSPKVDGYDDFIKRVHQTFTNENKIIYKIIDKNGRDFDSLSAGWKTSILLDLILGYDQDIAPIIIDQPEDNLATTYINKGLVDAIKHTKKKKQVILVSHNATIPMMADTQNIIYCQNESGKIKIRSARLEGAIEGENILDIIAEITDGGKKSIKKRVKKYNLKKFKES